MPARRTHQPRPGLRYAIAAALVLSACLAQKNELQDPDGGEGTKILQAGTAVGTVSFEKPPLDAEGNVPATLFRDVFVVAEPLTPTGAVIPGADTNKAFADDQGHWSMNALRVGKYRFTANKEHYAPVGANASVLGSQAITVPDLVLAPAQFSISGCVQLPPPASDTTTISATLTTVADPVQLSLGKCSNSEKGFPFKFTGLQPGKYTLQFQSDGFEGKQTPEILIIDSDINLGTLNLSRTSSGAASGTVTVADPTHALKSPSAVGVQISVDGIEATTTPYTTTTGDTGTYSFPTLPISPTAAHPYTVVATKFGYEAVTPDSKGRASAAITPEAAQPVTVSDIALKVGLHTISGCVAAPPPGNPASVTVSLTGAAFDGTQYDADLTKPDVKAPINATFSGVCSTSAQGSPAVQGVIYSLKNVPAGTYTVNYKLLGYEMYDETNVVVLDRDLTISPVTLRRATFSLKVTVTSARLGTEVAASVADAVVSVSGEGMSTVEMRVPAASDPTTATLTFKGIPFPAQSTEYELRATKNHYKSFPVYRRFQVNPKTTSSTTDTLQSIELDVSNAHVTACVLVPEPGLDATGVQTQLDGRTDIDATPVVYNRGLTDPCSTPDFPNIPGRQVSFASIADGTYSLRVNAAGYVPVSLTDFTISGVDLYLPTILLTRAKGVVRGTVIPNAGDSNLQPVLTGAIARMTGSDLLNRTLEAVVDSSGQYVFTDVPVSPTGQSYSIEIVKPDYEASGTTTVTLGPAMANKTAYAGDVTLTVKTQSIHGCISVPSAGINATTGLTATLSGTTFDGSTLPLAAGTATVTSTTATTCNGLPGFPIDFTGVANGHYSIQVTSEGYEALTIPGIDVENEAVNLPAYALRRTTGTVSGTIDFLNAGTGIAKDFSGAVVTLTGSDPNGKPLQVDVDKTTGNFILTGVPTSPTGANYTLTVAKANLTSSAPSTVRVNAGQSVPPSTTLSLTVTTDRVVGCVAIPPPGTSTVSVTLDGKAFDGSTFGPRSATTISANCPNGVAGRQYTFTGIPNGTYAVHITATGFDPYDLNNVIVRDADATAPTAQLVRSNGAVTGTITATDGSNTGLTPDVSGAVVTMTGPDLLNGTYTTVASGSGTSGTFSFPVVSVSPSASAYGITATKPNYVTKISASVVPVSGQSTPATPSVTLEIAASQLKGCVLVPSPAANSNGVTVVLKGKDFNNNAYQQPPVGSPTTITSAGTCTSGEAGSEYQFTNVPNGIYSVTLTRTGFDSVTLQDIVVSGASFTLPTAKLPRATGTITGKAVAAANGTGLTVDSLGAVVTVTGADLLGIPYRTTITQASGDFTLTNIPVSPTSASYTVDVSKPNFTASGSATVQVDANVAKAASPTITLSAQASAVEGCVHVPPPATDSTGVTVALTGKAFTLTDITLSASSSGTCPDGQVGSAYSFASVPNGNYTLVYSRAGYNPISLQTVVAGARVMMPYVEFGRQTGTVTGLIQESAGTTTLSAFAPGASVTLTTAEQLGVTYYATVDNTRHYTFTNVPVSPSNTPYSVTVSKPGYTASTPASVTVVGGSTVTAAAMTLTVRGSTVRGCVSVPPPAANSNGVTAVLNGTAFDTTTYKQPVSPLPSAAIKSSGPCTTSGSTGSEYFFSNVANGQYSIQLTLAGYDTIVIPTLTVADADAIAHPVTLTRSVGGVSGQVVASVGSSGLTAGRVNAANATVTLTGGDLLGVTYSTMTDASGNFAFSNIPVSPASTPYTVTVSKANYTTGATPTAIVQSGSVTALTSTITITPAFATATGCVYVPPPAADSTGVTVTMTGTASVDGQSFSPTSTTSAGTCPTNSAASAFSLANVPNGTYSIQLSRAGYETVTVPSVVMSGTALTLPLVQMNRTVGTVTGRVDANPGQTGLVADRTGISVTLTSSELLSTPYTTLTDSSGNFTLAGVPISLTNANYTLTVSKTNYVAPAAVSLKVPANGSFRVSPDLSVSIAESTLSGCIFVPLPGGTDVSVTLRGVAFDGTTYPAAPRVITTLATGVCPSNANGLGYSFAHIPNGTYSLDITSTGYESATVPGVVIAGSNTDAPAATLRRTTGVVAGRVTASAGSTGLVADVTGAVVTVRGGDLVGQEFTTTLDATGLYSFPAVPTSPTNKTYTVTATKGNYASASATATVGTAVSTINLVMAASTITGCVQVPPPAPANATVNITISGTAFDTTTYPPAAVNGTIQASGTCPNGVPGQAFQFSAAPNGTYSVSVASTGFDTITLPSFSVEGNVRLPALTMSRSSGRLYGTIAVLDTNQTKIAALTTDPQGVTVTVTTNDSTPQPFTATTDANGAWTIDSIPVAVPSGAYTVTASKGGFTYSPTTSPLQTTVVAGSSVQVSGIRMLYTGSKVTGCVTATGVDPTDVTATISGIAFNGTAFPPNGSAAISVTTGTSTLCGPSNNGRTYLFTNIPNGVYTIVFTRTNTDPVALSNVVVASADVTNPVASFGKTNGTVTGRVTVPAPATDSSGVTASLTGTTTKGVQLTIPADGLSIADGTYNFGSVAPGTYTLSLSKTNYGTVTVQGIIVVAGATVSVATQTMAVATGGLNGRVTINAGSVPITLGTFDNQGVSIRVDAAGLATPYTTTTDSNGDWFFSSIPVLLSGGSYTITAQKPGYQLNASTPSVSGTVVAGISTKITPNLQLDVISSAISGCVVLPAPATTSAGVSATLTGSAFNGTSFPKTGVTLSTTTTGTTCGGQPGAGFTFAGIPVGTYSVQLSATGYDVKTLSNITVSGTDVTTATVRLDRSLGTVTGVVVGADGGSGLTPDVVGALAVVSGPELVGGLYQASVIQTAAGSPGTFGYTIAGVPVSPTSTPYTVTITKASYSASGTAAVTVVANNTAVASPSTTLSIATSTVGGCIALTYPGNDSTGVSVVLRGTAFNGASYNSTTVQSTGSTTCGSLPGASYSFTNVPPGTYTVTFTKTGYTTTQVTGVSVIGATAVSIAPQTMGRAVGGLWGVVSTGDANTTNVTLSAVDLLNVAISITGTGLSSSYVVYPDTTGKWIAPSLPVAVPSAMYTVTATKAGFVNATRTITVVEGVDTQVSNLTMNAVGNAIAGTVTAVDGASDRSGVIATLSGAAFNGTPYTKTASASDAAGVFSFSNIPNGTYSVTLTKGTAYLPTTISNVVVPGTPTISGSLTRGNGTVGGRVTMSSGITNFSLTAADNANVAVTLTDATLSASFGTMTNGNGDFTLTGVPAGTYTVNLSKRNFAQTGTAPQVTVSPNVTSSVSSLAMSVAAGSLPVLVELRDDALGANAATYSTTPSITLTGVAFNGANFTATGNPTGTSTAQSFTSLPPGNYSVTATMAGHSTDGPKAGSVPEGAAGTQVTLTLRDNVAPTRPLIRASRSSPTSATSVTVSLVQSSTDANLKDYVIHTCVFPVPVAPATACAADVTWDGVGQSSAISLSLDVDTYISVVGRDKNGNESTPSTVTMRSETRAPNAPTNVKVDNRSGGVSLSWTASTTTGLPISGYRVYYGPLSSTDASKYTGTNAVEGASPITVGNRTSFNLTGLPNGVPFFVAIAAYDTVADPSPNVSALSSAVKALPYAVPLDRVVHQQLNLPNAGGALPGANAMSVFRNEIVVSSTTAGGYRALGYRYTSSGLTNTAAPITAFHGQAAVSDGNQYAFAFDPGSTTNPGLDTLAYDDAVSPQATLTSTNASPIFDLLPIHAVLPMRRTLTTVDSGTPLSRSGAVAIVTDTSVTPNTVNLFAFRVVSSNHGTFFTGFQNGNNNTNQALRTQTAPETSISVGNYVLTLHDAPTPSLADPLVSTNDIRIDAYGMTTSFQGTATNAGTVALTNGGTSSFKRLLVSSWPRLYFTGGTNNNIIYEVDATAATPGGALTFSTPVVAATLVNGATKMVINGDILYVAERVGAGTTALEAFSLAAPKQLKKVGAYELPQAGEMGSATDVVDLSISGANLFLLFNVPGTGAFLDVIEIGSPKAMVDITNFAPVVNGSLYNKALGVATHGSQAIAYMADGNGTNRLFNIDLVSSLNGAVSYTVSNAITSNDTALCPTNGPCQPLAVSGDYAFVAQTDGTTYSVAVFDISTPEATSGAAPLTTLAADGSVTSLAVSNDYLVVAQSTSTNKWLQRWDLTTLFSATPKKIDLTGTPLTSAHAYSVDMFGANAYVATDLAFCKVRATEGNDSTFAATNCFTLAGGASHVSVDAGNIYVNLGTPPTAGQTINVYATSVQGSPVVTTATATKSFSLGSATMRAMSLLGAGPYLYSTYNDTAGSPALVGFDTTQSGTNITPLATAPTLSTASRGTMSVSGPYVLVPDNQRGLVIYRTY